jgi:hypothetical protein
VFRQFWRGAKGWAGSTRSVAIRVCVAALSTASIFLLGFESSAHADGRVAAPATTASKRAPAREPETAESYSAAATHNTAVAPAIDRNLVLAQAPQRQGDAQPEAGSDSASTEDPRRHGVTDTQIEVGINFDDNVSRGRLAAEKRSDVSANIVADRSMVFPLTQNTQAVLLGSIGGEKFRSYDGLDRIYASLRAELQFRASGEFTAPTLAAFGQIIGEQYQSKLRRGYRASMGASVRQSVTDRIQLSGEVAHNERITTGDVFSTRDNSLRLGLDYALNNDSTLYLAGEHRRGDTVSSGLASLPNIDIAKLFVLDDAFPGGQTYAYKFEARTNVFTLGLNVGLGSRDSLDISLRRARATPRSRPSFDAPGPWNYSVDQVSVFYLVRF